MNKEIAWIVHINVNLAYTFIGKKILGRANFPTACFVWRDVWCFRYGVLYRKYREIPLFGTYFGPRVYPRGSLVIALVCWSICPWSVRGPSLNISETVHWFFLIFCMKLEHHKGTKVFSALLFWVTQLDFYKIFVINRVTQRDHRNISKNIFSKICLFFSYDIICGCHFALFY